MSPPTAISFSLPRLGAWRLQGWQRALLDAPRAFRTARRLALAVTWRALRLRAGGSSAPLLTSRELAGRDDMGGQRKALSKTLAILLNFPTPHCLYLTSYYQHNCGLFSSTTPSFTTILANTFSSLLHLH